MAARNCAVALLLTASVAILAAGCLGEQLEENKRQLEQQGAQLQKLQADLAALQAQRTYAPAGPPPGGCDEALMYQATSHGGGESERGNLSRALGYYQDAVTACPGNARAELNLARTYEAMGDQRQAVAHYRKASTGVGDATASEQAREALGRLSLSR